MPQMIVNENNEVFCGYSGHNTSGLMNPKFIPFDSVSLHPVIYRYTESDSKEAEMALRYITNSVGHGCEIVDMFEWFQKNRVD